MSGGTLEKGGQVSLLPTFTRWAGDVAMVSLVDTKPRRKARSTDAFFEPFLLVDPVSAVTFVDSILTQKTCLKRA